MEPYREKKARGTPVYTQDQLDKQARLEGRVRVARGIYNENATLHSDQRTLGGYEKHWQDQSRYHAEVSFANVICGNLSIYD